MMDSQRTVLTELAESPGKTDGISNNVKRKSDLLPNYVLPYNQQPSTKVQGSRNQLISADKNGTSGNNNITLTQFIWIDFFTECLCNVFCCCIGSCAEIIDSESKK